MSKEKIKISEDLYDIMPQDYQDLVKSATYGKEGRGWKDIGNSKELIEQHSLCLNRQQSRAVRGAEHRIDDNRHITELTNTVHDLLNVG